MARIEIHGTPDRDAALACGVVNAINYGTMRSGSSLIFTILCDWFPRNTIVKTHAFMVFEEPHNPPIVASYRDFRDAAVSQWRMRINEPGRLMTEEEIQHMAAGQHYNAFVLKHYAKYRPNSLFVRYEDDVLNVPRLIRRMADFFGVQASDEEIAQQAARHHIDVHRREANGEVPRPDNAPWMESHIHDGAVGCWKDFTPVALQPMFTELLEDELKLWKYI